MRRASVLLLLLLLAAPAAAQSNVATATLRIERALDVSGVTDDGGDCGADGQGMIVPATNGSGFWFYDPLDEVTCARVSMVVQMPAGAASMELLFRADKVVESATSAALFETSVDPQVTATVSVEGDAKPLFQDEAAWVEHYPVTARFAPRTTAVTVDWTFADLGPGITDEVAIGALPGLKVTISVSQPVVRFEGIDALVGLTSVDADVSRAQIERHMRAEADVTEADGDTELEFTISNAWSIHHVELPDGRTLDLEAFQSREVGGTLYLTIPSDVITEFGSGTYTAVFAGTVPLEPTVGLVPFILILAVAPVVAGAYTTSGAVGFQRRASGQHAKTARILVSSVFLLWGVYVITGLVVLIGRMWPLIVSWPIQLQAAMVHAAFVAVAAGFVLLDVAWRRRLEDLFQSELIEKERVNRQLKRSNDELEQFAYVASHDLQEPLRTVARFTQLLQHRYGAELPADANEFMSYSVEGAQRMQSLIDDLLVYSRVDSRGAPLAPTQLAAAFDRAKASLAATIEETGATVTAGPLPEVMGDSGQLAQVLQNLIGNGIKFRRPDVAPKVHVEAEPKSGMWLVRVADNGIGIPAEHRERIFTVFQRLHGRDKYEGTGIGLAVCKKIVERHGGTIWVEPTASGGSAFCFTLSST